MTAKAAGTKRVGSTWMPPLLVEACEGDRALLAWGETLAESWQREIVRYLTSPVHEETRERRAAQMAERLMLTMEAEVELPPAIARGLGSVRGGRVGWERMTANTRRTFLMTIFGARSEEARENQIRRMVEACAARGARES